MHDALKEFVSFSLTDHMGNEFFAPKISGNSRSRRLEEMNSDSYFHLNFEFSAFGSDFSFGLKRNPSVFTTSRATIITGSGSHAVIARADKYMQKLITTPRLTSPYLSAY